MNYQDSDVLYIFDVDGTLTEPRQELNLEMASVLTGLSVPFAIAGGSDYAILEDQFFNPLAKYGFVGSFHAYMCNGATKYNCEITGREEFTIKQTSWFSLSTILGYYEVWALIAELKGMFFNLPVPVNGDVVVDRGSMLNFTPIGRPSRHMINDLYYDNRAKFVEFDKRTGFRKNLLIELREKHPELEITLGGQTSFDISVKLRNKSFAIKESFCQGAKSIIYFGDALFPDGNDYAVVEFLKLNPDLPAKVIQVNGWKDTREKIRELEK